MRVVCLPMDGERREVQTCAWKFMLDPPESDLVAREGAGPLGPRESAKSAALQTPDFSKPAGGRV